MNHSHLDKIKSEQNFHESSHLKIFSRNFFFFSVMQTSVSFHEGNFILTRFSSMPSRELYDVWIENCEKIYWKLLFKLSLKSLLMKMSTRVYFSNWAIFSHSIKSSGSIFHWTAVFFLYKSASSAINLNYGRWKKDEYYFFLKLRSWMKEILLTTTQSNFIFCHFNERQIFIKLSS